MSVGREQAEGEAERAVPFSIGAVCTANAHT